jgi:redox-sensing transcriptional repressor
MCKVARVLEGCRAKGRKHVFADELATKTGIPAYQIRKDINYLGRAGKPGRGYDIDELLQHINEPLGLTEKKNAILIGVGSLGMTFVRHTDWATVGAVCVAAFGPHPVTARTIGSTPIHSLNDLASFLDEKDIDLAVIATAYEPMQELIDTLAQGGVAGVLSLVPVEAEIPEEMTVRRVDLSLEIQIVNAMSAMLGKNAVS